MDRKGWKFALSNKTRQDFKEGKKVLFFFSAKKKRKRRRGFSHLFRLEKRKAIGRESTFDLAMEVFVD